MPTERAPRNPLPANYHPADGIPHQVADRQSWESIAKTFGLDTWGLIEFNFNTRDPAEVNWYLRRNVGCNKQTVDGKNWLFSASAKPGIIYLPPPAAAALGPKANLLKIAILTLVSNAKGLGPGHSAIVVGSEVYTFEEIAGFYGDSWLIVNVREYLRRNEHRPVVVQELNGNVNRAALMRYIQQSIQRDDDYGGSGVCSSQVANAIDAATSKSFDPVHVDTPRKVYELARNAGIVARTYYYWTGESRQGPYVRTILQDRMTKEYDGLPSAPANGCLSW